MLLFIPFPMTYKGRFTPQNPAKYNGNIHDIVYRSLWERQLFKWLDENPVIAKWASEETVVPYRCRTDNRMHRYFVDVKFITTDNRTYLVEVKPAKETKPPKNPGRKTKRYITEVMTYAKNTSKWEAANEYAKDRGWTFEIWDENILRSMGIKIL